MKKNTQNTGASGRFESYIHDSLSTLPTFDVTARDIIRIHEKKGDPSHYYRLNIFMSKKIYIPVGIVALTALALIISNTGQNKVAIGVGPTTKGGNSEVQEVIKKPIEVATVQGTGAQVVPKEVVRKPVEVATLKDTEVVDAIVDGLFADQASETIDGLAVIDSYATGFSVDDINSITANINTITI